MVVQVGDKSDPVPYPLLNGGQKLGTLEVLPVPFHYMYRFFPEVIVTQYLLLNF